MRNDRETSSVRTRRGVCKLPRTARRTGPFGAIIGLIILFAGGCLAPHVTTVQLSDLESAPPARCASTRRVRVTDPASLRAMCTPLGPRLGLIQIRSRPEWQRLSLAVDHLGPCPNLADGIVVGLACWAGEPLNQSWPVAIDAVRVHRGAGLVEAEFRGGCYLPDESSFLETAHVQGLRAVLAVDINGTSFYPEQP
jgi:hypothetical protein